MAKTFAVGDGFAVAGVRRIYMWGKWFYRSDNAMADREPNAGTAMTRSADAVLGAGRPAWLNPWRPKAIECLSIVVIKSKVSVLDGGSSKAGLWRTQVAAASFSASAGWVPGSVIMHRASGQDGFERPPAAPPRRPGQRRVPSPTMASPKETLVGTASHPVRVADHFEFRRIAQSLRARRHRRQSPSSRRGSAGSAHSSLAQAQIAEPGQFEHDEHFGHHPVRKAGCPPG